MPATESIDLVERRTLAALRRVFATLSRRLDRERALRALDRRDWQALADLVRASGYDSAIAAALRNAVRSGALVGARTVQLETQLALSIASRHAIDWAEEHAAELVTRIDETTRDAIRTLVVDAMDMGRAAQSLRDSIAEIVPLLPRQVIALARFADEVADPQAVRAYAVRLRYARALMIARTEAGFAVNRGRLEAYRSATRVRRVRWYTADDEIVCPVCEPLDGLAVEVGETFADSGVSSPPAHPNCRCTIGAA
uniref:Hypothetical conserved protein n=1 Tax=uncultured prokaryote TaxID=198431 RepID=H5SEF1_9ZZZZ|nr:hypothetical conserved protein [uncultured prokaryote]